MLKCLLICLLPCALSAFELAPWFTPLAEFNLSSSYSCRKGLGPWFDQRYSSYLPRKKGFSDCLLGFNLGVTFRPHWDCQIGTRFYERRRSFHMQWIGMQVRHLMMNDVAGDPLSLAIGGQLLFSSHRHAALDPGVPYYGICNAELGVSAGKEVAKLYDWRCRGYAFLGLGSNIFGPFWLRPLLSGEIKCGQHHRYELFAQGYFDRDPHCVLPIIESYRAKSRQCIDVGVGYLYAFKIWGSFGIRYTHRVYAKSIPSKHLKILTFEYTLPFSIF